MADACRHSAPRNRFCPCLGRSRKPRNRKRLGMRRRRRCAAEAGSARSRGRMRSARQSIRQHSQAVAIAGIFLVASIGVMGAATDMAGAIIAQGTLVVESNVKKVQHPSGGVAKKLLVEDGAHVAEGGLLILMDETVAQA